MKIFPLSEGTFTIGHDKLFIPFDVNHDVLEERSTGSLLVEVQPFLVQTKHDLILLDTGLGFHLANKKLQIHENIAKAGFNYTDITKVVLSHLHKDHAGGISYVNQHKERLLTFPNATHYIYKPEFDYALKNPGASYLIDEFDFLEKSNQVEFYTEETGELFACVSHRFSGGHCKEHQVIILKEDNETYFYAGDEASQIKQLKIRYVAKYDFDGKKAADLRATYATEGIENDYTFLFYHDVKLPLSKL